nr:MAG TPA: hypothetical protein [Caudoviricetes sp.]
MFSDVEKVAQNVAQNSVKVGEIGVFPWFSPAFLGNPQIELGENGEELSGAN